MISLPSRFGFRARPAPDGPVGATTTTSRPSTRPPVRAGWRPSVMVVGKQPGTATLRVFASASRWPGSSGSPYGQVPAWGVP